ncbi:concanavalin A-like lectin/glucanase domain-containing protein [Cristinia sonorae]|uniref:Concanavalin A-like lectin/glucanase domain-containing protein n=1 Tax=Cristinia sonorae TaxID=1940300 RepID=A0A8K0UMQ3_9AGAR|nr:concanavalin A-like lectin/glucanase domain-containing protein [Cristinia sonorae]
MESLTRDPVAAGVYANTTGYSAVRNGSDAGFGESTSQVSLERPYAPFMDAGREGAVTPPSPTASQSNLYRSSAAGAMNGSSSALPNNEFATIPRSPSAPQIAMRAPFLSPASRPTSIWSPPSHPYPPSLHSPPSLSYLPGGGTGTPPTSYSYVPKPTKTKTLMPSTRLSEKLTKEDKPWIATKPAGRIRLSWWLTFLCFVLGIGAGAVICFFGWTGVKQLKDEDLCMVLNEDFSSGSLDANTWSIDSEMSGFGNGEFQMTTTDSANLHVTNGQLYLVPTLTSDEIGKDKLMNGYTYKLPQCSAAKTNSSACQMTSSALKQQVIPPVKSARVNTKGKVNIRFGKVEVRAKLPKGDWLWPAIWMLPEDDTIYGPWPLGGEMDIMEARGNGLEYGAQGLDFVRSSLNYGVLDAVQTHIFGWWSSKRKPYNKDFHTYAMEWTPDWMRFYVDTKLQATINMKITGKGGHDFFTRGHFPKTAHNNSDTEVVVQNIWANAGGSPAAPFDQAFYLILDLAAGGTSGWFPDNIGNKPWFDNSGTAMRDFALAQDTWHATWATNENDLAFRVDSVKMWKLGRCGN